MKYHRHFIIEGRHLGTAEIAEEIIHGTLIAPVPFAYFCPKCAELWARFPIEGSVKNWQVYHQPCRKHSHDWFSPAGALFLSWKPEFLETFPDEAVRWEFERWMNFYESTIQGEIE